MIEALTLRLRAAFDRVERRVLPPVLEPGTLPWMSLIYLMFLGMPAIMPNFPRADWGLTALAFVLFLPMYFAFYWVRGARRVFLLVAMAALAAALMPANHFSNTFLIYSNVLAAFLPMRRMLAVFVVTQSIYIAAVAALDMPDSATRLVVIVNVLPAVLSMVCNRVYIANQRKNQALRLSQDEVQRLARVAERERIGRDLHDLLGHTLSVVALKAELATRLVQRDPEGAAREIADVQRVAREALGQVRRAVSGMRALGLRAELANARLALAAVEVDFEYAVEHVPALHPELETTLALALREATTNVIRHAAARRCRCDIARDGEQVVLRFKDDGLGGATLIGNGLAGMRERAEAAGGTLEVESRSGHGTQLVLRAPYREAPPPEVIRDERPAEAPPKLVVVR